MNECLVCKKELEEPIMVCFDCSSNRKEEVFKAIEELVRLKHREMEKKID